MVEDINEDEEEVVELTEHEQYLKETYKLNACQPDDPTRCKANIRGGQRQCNYRAVELTEGVYGKYCVIHHGGMELTSQRKKDTRNYQLGKWNNRVQAFADNPQVKSLREEIGIVRMLLEQIIDRCGDENELLQASPHVADLVIKIEKLVTSCHRLEASTGMLLDKTSALKIASAIVDIIGKHVFDSDVVDKIAEDIIATIIGEKKE